MRNNIKNYRLIDNLSNTSLTQQLTSAIYESAITTGTNTALQSAVNGDSFSEALENQVINTIVMAGAKLGANAIGESYHTDEIGKATQLTLHAALGATVNLLTGNDALSGAISGVVGELAGEVFQDMGYNKTDGSNLAGLVSGLSSIITSKVEGLDVDEISDNAYSGQRIGVNAALNNAYIPKRALQGSSWLDMFSDNDTLDELNLEYSHEQIFWEDIPGDNTGYFDDGTVRADKVELLNMYKDTGDDGYIDSILRQAVDNVTPKDYNLFDFSRITGIGNDTQYNCQDWMQDVRDEYNKLLLQNTIDNLNSNPLVKAIESLN